MKFGDGVHREAVWMAMLPLFSQLQKRNYWTEAFVHIINIIVAWPLATRKILQNNCSVGVKDRDGHNIDLDESVETYLVQPLKNYASGLSILQIINYCLCNTDMVLLKCNNMNNSFYESN